MMMWLSVVICSHNPRPDYLSRVLDALRAQTLTLAQWELLLVDNDSAEPLSAIYDVHWHPAGRHIRENKLGLTHARLRGIVESRGAVIAFVDDDNVLHPAFLEGACEIAKKYSHIGAWGPSHIIAEYEVQPSPKLSPYLHYLALRDIEGDHWSNSIEDWSAIPLGAGLCVRRETAERYAEEVRRDSVRLNLDRRGTALTGGGDIDLAWTPRLLGQGWGTFDCLSLVHLIPSGRVQKEYLLRLVRATASSLVLVNARAGQPLGRVDKPLERFLRTLYMLFRKGPTRAQFLRAYSNGAAEGKAVMLSAATNCNE